MKPRITCISIISFIFFISIIIAGCTTLTGRTSSPPVTISPTMHPDDFVITISKNGFGNVTSTINRNLSEIQSRNFSEIPVLLDLKNTSYCGYSSHSNYSAVADVALHDSRIRKMLIDGGIVKGIYAWGPPTLTKEQSEDPCSHFSVTLELNYRGNGVTALINESTGSVILPQEFS